MGGIQVVLIENVVLEIDILVSSTSDSYLITSVHMKQLKNSSLVGNTRRFVDETDFAGSEGLEGMNPVYIKPRNSLFVPFGHSVIVLFQTYKNKVYFLPLETLSFPRSVGCQRLSHHFVIPLCSRCRH